MYGLYWGYIGLILGLYWGYIGMMENEMKLLYRVSGLRVSGFEGCRGVRI